MFQVRVAILHVAVFALTATAFIARHQSLGGEQSKLEQEFVSRYPPAASHFERLFSTVTISATLTTEHKIGTKDYSKEVAAVLLSRKNNGMKKCIITLGSEGAGSGHVRKRVFCKSSAYSFILQSTDDNSTYMLKSLDGANGNGDRNYGALKQFFGFVDGVNTIETHDLKALILDPHFSLRSASPVKQNDIELIKFEFDYGPNSGQADSQKKDLAKSGWKGLLKSGWFTASPREGWAIHENESHLRGALEGTVNSTTVEYKGTVDGVPIPNKIVLRRGKSTRFTFEIDQIDFDTPSDDGFALAFFGLPELASPDSDRRKSPAFWLFSLAILTFVAAMGVKYYASRSSKHRSQTA